jgi:hypothetical protein
MALTILLSLAVLNGFWAIQAGFGGPLIASLFYIIVFALCLWKRHYKAGLFAAAFGFGIHLFELLSQGIRELESIERLFFVLNLILPLPLALMSHRASSRD